MSDLVKLLRGTYQGYHCNNLCKEAADRIGELEKQATLDIVSLAVAKLTKKRLKLAEGALEKIVCAITLGAARSLAYSILRQLREE